MSYVPKGEAPFLPDRAVYRLKTSLKCENGTFTTGTAIELTKTPLHFVSTESIAHYYVIGLGRNGNGYISDELTLEVNENTEEAWGNTFESVDDSEEYCKKVQEFVKAYNKQNIVSGIFGVTAVACGITSVPYLIHALTSNDKAELVSSTAIAIVTLLSIVGDVLTGIKRKKIEGKLKDYKLSFLKECEEKGGNDE